MNTHISATGLDIAFKGFLLPGIKDVAGGIKKYHSAVPAQVFLGKSRGIFCEIGFKALFRSHFLNGFHTGFNRIMAEARGFAEYQQFYPAVP
ncbi:hypothetical protein FQZ97_975300 [compost metagenome]